MKSERNDQTLTVFLSGEIDHHSAAEIRAELDAQIEEFCPKRLVMNFSEVGFMDSSGIGLVMGRYKLMQLHGGEIEIQNPPAHIKKVMRLSGIDKLAKI